MRGPPPGFVFRAVAIEAGVVRIYNEAEWRDTLVVVTSGELELEAADGGSCRFGRGSVLCLVGLPLRALRSGGTEPAVLVTVSRAMSLGAFEGPTTDDPEGGTG